MRNAGWIVTDSKTNATATAAKAADASKQHIVKQLSASFSASTTALLQLKDGNTPVWEGYVVDSAVIEFSEGIAITFGNACSAVLAAGGAGVVGKVNMHGITF